MNQQVRDHFQKVDPTLYSYISKIEDFELTQSGVDDYFLRLIREIAYQQLAGKAASAIWKRFLQLFGTKIVTPLQVIKLKHEDIRAVGLSNAKANYIRNISQAILDKQLNFQNYANMTDEEIIANLTQVKGIGRWTAEMFLMFTLGRSDIFSEGDYGLRKGFKKVYGYKKDPNIKTIRRIVKKWSPYRTYGSMVLWKALEL